MANNLGSNTTEKVLRKFLDGFESDVVTLKTIDRQVISNMDWDPSSGETIKVKRPHDYFTRRTADGDVSSGTNNSILSGSAVATVQEYFTIRIDWTQKEQALKLDQLDKIIAPIRKRFATDIEVDFNQYMLKHTAHLVGTAGTSLSQWSDVSAVDAYTRAFGFPDTVYAQIGPYGIKALADAQKGIFNSTLASSAWERAQINMDFGGVMAYRSNALASHTNGAATGSSITLGATPTQTYAGAKDTFQTTLSLAGLGNSITGAVKAGDMLRITDNSRYWLNQSTKQTMHDDSGPVKWTCVVTADANSDGSGDATVIVEGPAIRESNGQYNTISAALASGDAVDIISGTSGASPSTNYPNLFYHKQAFGVQFIELDPLQGWDSTVMTAPDGSFSIRATRYSEGDANTQKMRFDVLPAYVCYNPLLAGRFFGA